MTGPQTRQPSVLERVDLALAARMVAAAHDDEPLAAAQRVLDGVRRPAPGDVPFLASLLRLRGFVINDDDVTDIVHGRPSRLAPVTQEHRLVLGLRECLRLLRQRAAAELPPDGWFLVDLFRTLTSELPRFRNNELRRGPPWDAVHNLTYPAPEQLRSVLDGFDAGRCYRDVPLLFQGLHPVRQGFRLLWRLLRIAPFHDFNFVMAWLGMNAWLQCKGFPLLPAAPGDQQLLVRMVGGPPPTKLAVFEGRLLESLGEAA